MVNFTWASLLLVLLCLHGIGLHVCMRACVCAYVSVCLFVCLFCFVCLFVLIIRLCAFACLLPSLSLLP